MVGLFAPPLLAATAIGAALGAGVGKAVQRKVTAGIEQQAEDSIPIGGAGLMVAYPPSSAPAVEAAVTRAISRVVGEGRGRVRRRSRPRSPTRRAKTAESAQMTGGRSARAT